MYPAPTQPLSRRTLKDISGAKHDLQTTPVDGNLQPRESTALWGYEFQHLVAIGTLNKFWWKLHERLACQVFPRDGHPLTICLDTSESEQRERVTDKETAWEMKVWWLSTQQHLNSDCRSSRGFKWKREGDKETKRRKKKSLKQLSGKDAPSVSNKAVLVYWRDELRLADSSENFFYNWLEWI